MRIHTAMLATLLVASSLVPALGQEIPVEGPAPTTALINAESKSSTPINPSTLTLEVNGHATPIDSISSLRQNGAQVAILIDDGLRASFGVQLRDLTNFVMQLPPNVQVLIGYMQNGTVRSSGRFTADHAEVSKQIRLPFSSPGMSGSPYFCLSEFVKHWPSNQPAARVVLMISNGVDPYNGSVSPLNQNSPYVQAAQEDAQRAGVAVYSIYYGDRGERGNLVSFSGQGYLQQVAEATGGRSFYNGTITPPSLTPFFKQFTKALSDSYIIGFKANTTHEKGRTLARLKLRTTQSGVKLHAPDGVHPGLVE